MPVNSNIRKGWRGIWKEQPEISDSDFGIYVVTDAIFGAVGDGATDDTSAVQAAIDAAGTSGTVFFPPGTYALGQLYINGSGGVTITGAGVGTTVLKFVPTGNNQTLLRIGEGTGTVCRFCGITDLQITTAEYTYNKTAISLVDCGETRISNVYIQAFYGNADIVGLYTRGRESLWVDNVQINATIPIRIGINPATTSGWLSSDHFTFNNCYLNAATWIPSSLVSACVLVDNGAQVSQLQFTGSQAWVGARYGFYWNSTGDPYTYSSGLRFENVRTEQGISPASYYSFYITCTQTTPTYNVSFENCEFDTGRNGLFSTNVTHINFNSCYMFQASPLIFMNVSDAYSVRWEGMVTSSTAGTTAVTIDSNMYMAHSEPQSQGIPWPHTATWTRRATSAVYNERPAKRMSGSEWAYAGILSANTALQIPINTTNNWGMAKATVYLVNTTAGIREHGEFWLAPVSVAGTLNGIEKGTATAQVTVGDVTSALVLYADASAMSAPVYVKNRFATDCYVSIEVFGFRTSDT